jgi:SAM-dependent methyltransferase
VTKNNLTKNKLTKTKVTKSDGEPWWKAAFGAHYQTLYAHRDDASAVAEVAGLLPRLRQVPGPILDACCGNGRHLAALRAAGLPAFGFDLSADLLRSANHRSQCRERMVRCDMRTPAVSGGWGAVLVLFTAFGYFDDKTNAACLATFTQLLAPGGLLVLDLPNPQAIKQKLIPYSERMTPDGHVVEERSICQGRVEKTVTLSRDGRVIQSYRESVRLYERSEIAVLAHRAELQVAEVWPSLRGPDSDEQRCVYWLKRS